MHEIDFPQRYREQQELVYVLCLYLVICSAILEPKQRPSPRPQYPESSGHSVHNSGPYNLLSAYSLLSTGRSSCSHQRGQPPNPTLITNQSQQPLIPPPRPPANLSQVHNDLGESSTQQNHARQRSGKPFLKPFLSFTSTPSLSTCIGLPYQVLVTLPFFVGVLYTRSLSTFIGVSLLAASEVNNGLLSSSVRNTDPAAPRRFDGLHSRSE